MRTEPDDFPEGWDETPLINLISALESGSRPKGGVRKIATGVPSIGGEHLDAHGGFRFEKLKFVPQTFYKGMTRGHIRRGDVLVVKDGATTGKVSLIRDDFPYDPAVVNEHVYVCRPAEGIKPEFLFRFLFSPDGQERILDHFKGAAQGGITQEFAAGTLVPVAPFAEQRRIVAKVEELLAQVNQVRKRLARVPAILKRFRQSVLSAACSGTLTAEWRSQHQVESVDDLVSRLESAKERYLARMDRRHPEPHVDDAPAFEWAEDADLPDTWRVVCALDLIDIQNGRSFPSKQYADDGVRLLRPGNLHVSGMVEWNRDNTVFMPARWAKEYPDFVLGSDELVVNLTAQSLKDEFLGRVCIKRDSYPALLNQRIGRFVSFGEDDLRPYLLVYYKSPRFRAYVDLLDAGTLIRHMHAKHIFAHGVPLPPMEEQREIVRRVEELFKLADDIEKQVEAATKRVDKLTQAILAKTFRGELVPTEAELARRERRSFEPASVLLERIKQERETSTAK